MGEKGTSVREVYRTSSDDVALTLELIGPQSRTEAARLPSERDRDSITGLLRQVAERHEKGEPESSYRTTLLQVVKWSIAALEKSYIEAHVDKSPHSCFVIRKGLEILHMLLHRDLRRKALSSSESQIYYDFVRLAGQLPQPTMRRSGKSQTGTHS